MPVAMGLWIAVAHLGQEMEGITLLQRQTGPRAGYLVSLYLVTSLPWCGSKLLLGEEPDISMLCTPPQSPAVTCCISMTEIALLLESRLKEMG